MTPAGANARGTTATCRDAFLFCFSVFEFARTAWRSAGPGANKPDGRYNVLFHRATLADSTARAVTTPNNDTIYSAAWMDLSHGCVFLDVPSAPDRYFSVSLINSFTDNFASIGTRATAGLGGRWRIAPPGWRRSANDGPTIVSETTDVWLLARILVDGESDLAPARAVQQGLQIASHPEASPPRIQPTDVRDVANMLDVVNEMLARNRSNRRVRHAALKLSQWGVRPGPPGAFHALARERQTEWTGVAHETLGRLQAGPTPGGAMVDGWIYPPPEIGSARASDVLRASVALSGLGAQELQEAHYARCDQDQAGAPLQGSSSYDLVIPGDVPARAFWSVSMYQIEADGRLFFTDNPLGRYALGSRTDGLVRRPDGSVRLMIKRAPPASEDSNWLPCPPGPFALVFRSYLPEPALLTGRWRLPGVRKRS